MQAVTVTPEKPSAEAATTLDRLFNSNPPVQADDLKRLSHSLTPETPIQGTPETPIQGEHLNALATIAKDPDNNVDLPIVTWATTILVKALRSSSDINKQKAACHLNRLLQTEVVPVQKKCILETIKNTTKHSSYFDDMLNGEQTKKYALSVLHAIAVEHEEHHSFPGFLLYFAVPLATEKTDCSWMKKLHGFCQHPSLATYADDLVEKTLDVANYEKNKFDKCEHHEAPPLHTTIAARVLATAGTLFTTDDLISRLSAANQDVFPRINILNQMFSAHAHTHVTVTLPNVQSVLALADTSDTDELKSSCAELMWR